MPVSKLEINLGTLLEESAGKHKDKIAIHFHHEAEDVTFEQLSKRVNQFANALKNQGVKKGDHVAVMLPNCPEFPYTWLGLAKLGAVMIPLNNSYQAKDLEYILTNSDACVLVIQDTFTSRFREAKGNTHNIKKIFIVGETQDDLGEILSELAAYEPDTFSDTDINVSKNDLMNIQYTSGTTGLPKGCMLTHEYWMLLGKSVAELMHEKDVFLCVTPFYYMDPQWELIMCLAAGCTMVITRKYSASRYMKWINQYNVTVSWATMAAWTLKQPESEYDKNHRLRFMFVGAFPPKLHKEFENRFNVKIREAFGMTEIGPGMFVPLEDDHMTGSGSVGKPLGIRKVKILDEIGKKVPQGETGELLIAGPGMLKGYYKNPEATKEVFDGGWFKTGDLFKQDENGYYYIVGRIKDMIRRSAENISAKEVENVLTSHPKIKSAAVIAVPDESRGEEVKAYIIPADKETSETIPPGEIIEYCSKRIARFKLPRYIEYKDTFPSTATGKIQKHLLIEGKEDLSSGCFDRTA